MIDLKGFRKDKKLSQEDLADILNVKQSFISQVERGVCPLPEAKIAILEEKYGDVIKKYDNPNLLIDNNNQTTYNRSDTNNAIIRNPNFSKISILKKENFDAYVKAGGDESFISQLPTFPAIVDPDYRGRSMCFEAVGESMDDSSSRAICDGDIVLCRMLAKNLWGMISKINKLFVIVFDKGITIKQIVKYDTEKNVILCHPQNILFNDFEIPAERVIELWIVDKIVERNISL